MSDAPPPEQRQRLQFSIRDLLMLSLLSCIGLSLLLKFLVSRYGEYDVRSSHVRISLVSYFLAGAIIAALTFVAGLGAILWRGRSKRRTSLLIITVVASWIFLCYGVSIYAENTFHDNIIAAGEACEQIADAQKLFSKSHSYNGTPEFARSLGELNLLLSAEIRSAEVINGNARPFCGFVFKLLKASGTSAPGGSRSYVVRGDDGQGHMIGGFVVLAIPVSEGDDYSFMINDFRKRWRKYCDDNAKSDLLNATEYNPDSSWHPY